MNIELHPMNQTVKALVALCDERCARKKHYFLQTLHYPMEMASYWDGGTRAVYHIVDLRTRRVARLPSNHPMFEPGRPYTLARALPENLIVVETGVFCGKVATPHIYLHDTKQLEGVTA